MTFQRHAEAEWTGDLPTGKGTVTTESGAVDAPYDAVSRFQDEGTNTNPEELIGAAHAACYSMALSNTLAQDGHTPESVRTRATVHLDMTDGPKVTRSVLSTEGRVPGIDQATFEKYAEDAKANCPISGALGALEIVLEDATLIG